MEFYTRPAARTYSAAGTSSIPRLRNPAPRVAANTPDPILVAVLGVTGAGKTKFINTAAGRPDTLEVGHSIFSCTRDIASLQMEIDGRPVTLIDTPGFDDTNLSDGEVLKIIAEWLGIMYENRVLLTGVILLQPVDGNRAYGSEAKRTQLFRQICGKDTYENVVIATTMWSKLRNRSEGVDRVRQREESGDFWANLVNNGEGKSAKLVEYHDNVDSAHNIIRMVMENTKKPLKLQVELHESQGRLIDTTAGQQVDAELGATTAKKIKELHACEMRQFKEQYKEDIEKLKAEIQRLQVQKMMIQQEKVDILDRVPPWLSALASSGSFAVAAAAIIIPIASGGCNIM